MTAYRIWPATSGGSVASDASTTDLGTEFYVTQSGCYFMGWWWWCPAGGDTSTSDTSFTLYSTTNGTTGTLLSGATFLALAAFTAGAWNYIPATRAVPLVAGTHYRTVAHYYSTSNHYSGTTGYWTTGGAGAAGITSGPLAAPSSANALNSAQGSYNEPSGSPAFPATASSNHATYWIDVQISAPSGAISQPVRARIPQTAPRGRTASSPGAPVQNPQPSTGPRFYPATQAVRARLPQQPAGMTAPRGRTASSPGAPVQNPAAGPVFRQKPAPVRFTLPPWQPRAGRIGSSFGAVIQNPVHGPPVYALSRPVRPAPQPAARGHVRATRVTAVPLPAAVPAFYPARQPARARIRQDTAGLIYSSAVTLVQTAIPGGSYSLFSQEATGASLAADPAPYTLGVEFSVTEPATLTGIWFYSAAGAAVLPQVIALYAVSGQTLLYSQAPSWSGSAGSGWVQAALGTSQALAANTAYKACVFQNEAADWYSSTSHFWDTGAGSGGIADGPLSAPGNAGGDGGQDTYNPAGSLAYPSSSFNAANYWVDPQVSVSNSEFITPLAAYSTGRISANPGAPVRNPQPPPTTGPAFYAKAAVRIRPALPPRGRTGSNPGAPVRNPPPPPPVPAFTYSPSAVPGFAQPGFAQPGFPAGLASASLPGLSAPVRARGISLPPRGRTASSQGTPARNPGTGPVFRPAVRPARSPVPQVFSRGRTASSPGAPLRNPAAGIPLLPPSQPAGVRVIFLRTGNAQSSTSQGTPARNPGTGPVFRPAVRPARIRPVLPRRGRVSSSPGGPVQNPGPVITGPPFFPKNWPARARIIPPPRGRVTSNPGAAVRNPHGGPAAYPAHGPVQARVPQVFSRGRITANPGTPAPQAAPVYSWHGPVRTHPALPPRGRTAFNAGIPAPAPVVLVPVYAPHGPVRSRITPPPRGRASGNPRIPVPPKPSPVYPLHSPVAARRPLPPHGRTTGNPGAPVRNPHAGPVFRQLNWPTRARIPQTAPRGRTASNPGGPVVAVSRTGLNFAFGSPYWQWGTEEPYFQWQPGTPGFQWATEEPYLS